jgi:hypothetical protein
MSIAAYPLQWPVGWKRTTVRATAAFGRARQRMGDRYIAPRALTIAEGTERALLELQRMGIGRDDIVLSTNLRLRLDGLPISSQSEPSDPGVAVYWREFDGTTRVIAIDRYDRAADNLAAVAATLDAMRAIERHGGAVILERAFTGFTALPAPGAPRTWWEELGVPKVASRDEAKSAFRALASQHHPDKGGQPERMAAINAAWEQAQRELP